MDTKPIIRIYTDGACKGNPGPGGFGVLVVFDGMDKMHEFAEHCEETTNNREELKAIIKALDIATAVL